MILSGIVSRCLALLTSARAAKLANLDAPLSGLSVTASVWKQRIYTVTDTWTCPAANTPVHVIAIGGGMDQYKSADGGDSSFGGTLVTAQGCRHSSAASGSPRHGAGYPVMGHGCSAYRPMYLSSDHRELPQIAVYTGTVSADQAVVVGAGAFPTGGNSAPGQDGAVIVYWQEEA